MTDETQFYYCWNCGNLFPEEVDVADHIRTSDAYNALTLVCRLCNSSFPHQCDLWAHHKRLHSGEPQHVCELCGRGFDEYHAMKKHLQEVHEKVKVLPEFSRFEHPQNFSVSSPIPIMDSLKASDNGKIEMASHCVKNWQEINQDVEVPPGFSGLERPQNFSESLPVSIMASLKETNNNIEMASHCVKNLLDDPNEVEVQPHFAGFEQPQNLSESSPVVNSLKETDNYNFEMASLCVENLRDEPNEDVVPPDFSGFEQRQNLTESSPVSVTNTLKETNNNNIEIVSLCVENVQEIHHKVIIPPDISRFEQLQNCSESSPVPIIDGLKETDNNSIEIASLCVENFQEIHNIVEVPPGFSGFEQPQNVSESFYFPIMDTVKKTNNNNIDLASFCVEHSSSVSAGVVTSCRVLCPKASLGARTLTEMPFSGHYEDPTAATVDQQCISVDALLEKSSLPKSVFVCQCCGHKYSNKEQLKKHLIEQPGKMHCWLAYSCGRCCMIDLSNPIHF